MNKFEKYLIVLFILLVLLLSPVIFTLSNIAGNYGDLYLHYYPLKSLVNENIIAGKLPLWNPYILAGQPLLANPQSSIFYPLSLLFFLFPLSVAFNYFIFIHFFICGIFIYLLLSYMKLSNTSCIFGSIVFTLSSFLISRVPAGHPIALSGYIWLPIILLALENIRKTVKIDDISVLLFVFAMSFQFLSGHFQPIYISSTLVLFHFIYYRFKYWKILVFSSAACLSLCALQFIPTLELSQVSETIPWKELTRSYSLPIKNIINFILPNYFGNIFDSTYKFPNNPSYFFELHSLYIGIIPLFLSISGLVISIKKRSFLWVFLFFIGMFLSFGTLNPIYSKFYWFIPGLKYIRAPARFIYLSITSLVIFAAVSWDYYFKQTENKFKILLFALIIFDLFLWGNKFIYTESLQEYRKKNNVSQIVNPLYRIVTEPNKMNANKSMLYHHFNLNGYETIFLQDFTRYIGLQETRVFSTTGLARTDLYSPLMKGFSVRYHITTKNLQKGNKVISLPNSLNIYEFPDALPLVYLAGTVNQLPDDVYEEIEYLKNTRLPPDEEITLTAMPKNFQKISEGGKIVSYNNKSSKISAEISLPEPGIVVFSEIFYPGWQAWSGKKPQRIYRGNKIFRTLFLTEGEYTGNNKIVLYFNPKSFLFGLILTLVTLVFIILYKGAKLIKL